MASAGGGDQGRIETSLARSPFFGGNERPFTGRSLLGTDDVGIRPRRLSSRDLAVLAYLIDRYLWPPPTRELDPAQFTLYDLGRAMYGREPAGEERRKLRAALRRLWDTEIVFGWQEEAGRSQWDRLLIRIESEMDRLAREDQLAEGRPAGALRGSTFRVTLTPWLAEAVREGHFTWLNFRVLRRLGGLSARLWVYLEAEHWKPQPGERESTWLGLGQPALATLGVDGYERHRDARRAVARAGRRIVNADARYESVTVEQRPGGWSLVAVRATGERRRKRCREQAERERVRTTLLEAGFSPASE
jgi:hypothetical protein